MPRDHLLVPQMDPRRPAYSIPIIGVPTEKLFPHMSFNDIARYYLHNNKVKMLHMNYSGATYFTQVIVPAIGAVYNEQALHKKPEPQK